ARRSERRRATNVARSRMRQISGLIGLWPLTVPPSAAPSPERSTSSSARRRNRSGRQPVAALLPPGADDGPSGAGGHAVTEAVFPRSLACVWLESALHLTPGRPDGEGRRKCVPQPLV